MLTSANDIISNFRECSPLLLQLPWQMMRRYSHGCQWEGRLDEKRLLPPQPNCVSSQGMLTMQLLGDNKFYKIHFIYL